MNTNTIISKIFFFVSCGAYAYELANRAAAHTAFTSSLMDPRMDVAIIALLGILAHFAFQPAAKVAE